ncbi:MAG: zf-HC2 domain-containing protein [Candidatus Obscuribacterales bacterium]|nr:zf-HC2 domain-containing protein [Candidatus Obscuribacterales bacterium]
MSNTGNCEEYNEWIDAYLDAELEESSRVELEAHLSSCERCALRAMEVSQLSSRLKALPRLEFTKELDFSFLEQDSGSSCLPYLELLDAYLDKELSSNEREFLQKHLDDCSNCSTSIQESKRIADDLKALPRLNLSRDFAELDYETMAQAQRTSYSCAEMLELIDAYHDSELSALQKPLVEKHLSSCSHCAEKLIKVKELVSQIQALPRVEAERDIVESLPLGKNAEVHSLDQARRRSADSRKRFGIYAFSATAAAALVFAFSFKMLPFANSPIASNTPAISKDYPAKPKARETRILVAEQGHEIPLAEFNEASTEHEQSREQHSLNHEQADKDLKSHEILSPNKTQIAQIDQNKEAAKIAELVPAQIAKQEALPELAAIPETVDFAGADALGIATDEDGLYDIKI